MREEASPLLVHAGHFGPMKDSESLSAIAAAIELGVNFIDTSDAYGAGYSEALLGQALRGRRDQVMIATKGGNVMVGPNRGKRNFEPDYISRVIDESLRRLQIDTIDLYQLHNPTVDVIERGAVWEVLERAKQAGKEVGIEGIEGRGKEGIGDTGSAMSRMTADRIDPEASEYLSQSCRFSSSPRVRRIPRYNSQHCRLVTFTARTLGHHNVADPCAPSSITEEKWRDILGPSASCAGERAKSCSSKVSAV